MLTNRFHDAALFINPAKAAEVGSRVAAQYGGTAEVSAKVRRLIDRVSVEHGYAVTVHGRDGSSSYVAEAA